MAFVAVTGMAFGAGAPGKAQPPAGSDPPLWTDVVSGVPALRNSPTGMLLAGNDEGYWPHCSLVLTRPGVALTAAHCLAGRRGPYSLKTYFPREGFRSVVATERIFPCAGGPGRCEDSLALLRLDRAYRLVPLAHQAPASSGRPGEGTTLQGFGVSNPLRSDNGLAHEGTATLDDCACAGSGAGVPGFLCFGFDLETPGGPGPTFINLQGDSGGAMFADSGAPYPLLGIAAGIDKACGRVGVMEARYFDTRKIPGAPELERAFCTADCAAAPRPEARVLLESPFGRVGSARSAQLPFRISETPEVLLINLNHEVLGFHPEPGGDLDLVPPAGLDAECERHVGVESCQISNPPPGAYSIGVERKSGNPAYQLTVVAIYEE